METKKNLRFIFFALMAWGEGISGGDKISIEFVRRWSKVFSVSVYLWEQGYRMYMRQNLNPEKIDFKVINMNPWEKFGFLVNYLARIFAGIWISLRTHLENEEEIVVYSATEFWMDFFPGLILKLRYPKITWVTTWFQTAPNPLRGFKEGDRVRSYRISALGYWLVQFPIKPLIERWADFVLVNNESERKRFPDMNKDKKVIVVLGAVDLSMINNFIKDYKDEKKIYDGVFQGRFHPQKGVVELIDIWKLVVDKKPDAKLALIGDGPLMGKVKEKIVEFKLEKNIKLFGFVFDGEKKYLIFHQSKVVLHPAFYDSGGMASLEAMAVGLPSVGFDLIAYESYYPKGMIKVPINNLQLFASAVLEFLQDRNLYSRIEKETKEMISKNWSWDTRAEQVLSAIR